MSNQFVCTVVTSSALIASELMCGDGPFELSSVSVRSGGQTTLSVEVKVDVKR